MGDFQFCHECGAPLKGDEQFCANCGASVKTFGKAVAWDYDIPVLTNRYILLDLLKAFGIPALLIGLFIKISMLVQVKKYGPMAVSQGNEWIYPLMMIFILIVLTVLLVFLIYRNRYEAHFIVDRQGARFATRKGQFKRNTTMNTLLMAAGILSGRPGPVGTGLIAQSMQFMELPWEEVHRVDGDPRHHVVILRNSWRRVMILYCTPENYEEVLALARDGVQRMAPIRDKEQPARKKTSLTAFFRLLALVVLIVLVSAAPLLDSKLPVWILSALTFLGFLMTGDARRNTGYISLFIWVGVVILMVCNGMQEYSYTGGYMRFSRFSTVLDGDDFYAFIASVAGMLGLLICIWGHIRCNFSPPAVQNNSPKDELSGG